MKIEVREGKVGCAGSGDTLVYPSITSCLTVTCITKEGGKCGAHLSMFPEKNGQAYHVMLHELRSLLSTGKVLKDVEVVWVVGVLDTWTRSLRPVGSLADGPHILKGKAANQQAAAELIKDRLTLRHLNSAQNFQFRMANEGDVSFSAGTNSGVVQATYQAGVDDESQWVG